MDLIYSCDFTGGEPNHGSTKIVTSDAMQVRLKRASSGILKAGSNVCRLITIPRQHGKSSENCIVKIKSPRLLEVGELSHGSTKIVTSDAVQVRLKRISSGILKAGSNRCMLLNSPH